MQLDVSSAYVLQQREALITNILVEQSKSAKLPPVGTSDSKRINVNMKTDNFSHRIIPSSSQV